MTHPDHESGDVMDALRTVIGIELPPDATRKLGELALPQPPAFAAHKIEGGGGNSEE